MNPGYKRVVLDETAITAFARTLIDDADAAEARDTLVLGADDSPTFTGLTLSGLTAARLVATDANKALASAALASWVAGTANRVTVTDDGDGTITLTGPQDIHTGASPTFAGLTIVNGVTEFSIDGTLGDNSDSALPTEKAVKTYGDAAVVGSSLYAFKTITGITNDVVADAIGDTLTLTSADSKLTIVGTAATDTITFTVNETQISHDNLLGFVADEHVAHAGVSLTARYGLYGGGNISDSRTIDQSKAIIEVVG